jgi:hypothetical protein
MLAVVTSEEEAEPFCVGAEADLSCSRWPLGEARGFALSRAARYLNCIWKPLGAGGERWGFFQGFVFAAFSDEQVPAWLRARTGGGERRLCRTIPMMLTSAARTAVVAAVAIAQR